MCVCVGVGKGFRLHHSARHRSTHRHHEQLPLRQGTDGQLSINLCHHASHPVFALHCHFLPLLVFNIDVISHSLWATVYFNFQRFIVEEKPASVSWIFPASVSWIFQLVAAFCLGKLSRLYQNQESFAV